MDYIGNFFEYALKTNNVILVFLILACAGLVYLVRWVLVTSRDREERYIATIDKLSEKFSIVERIKEAVERIEDKL